MAASSNIGKWSGQVSINADPWMASVKQIKDSAATLPASLQASFSAIGKNIEASFAQLKSGNIFGFLAGLQGGAVAGGISSLISGVKGIADAFIDWTRAGMDAIRMQARMSRELGVTREGAASLLAIGGAAGTAPDEIMHASRQALRHIGDLRLQLSAGQSGGEAGSWLRVLGIDPEQFARMSNFTEQLGLVGDRMRDIENASERAAAGHAIFGRSWETLQPQLRLGSEGLQRIEGFARQLGVTVGGETTESITATGRAMNEFRIAQQLAADGLRNQYVAGLMEATAGTRDYAAATQRMIEAQRRVAPQVREIGQASGTLSSTMQDLVIGQLTPLAGLFNFAFGSGPQAAIADTSTALQDEAQEMADWFAELDSANELWRTRQVAINNVTDALRRQNDQYGISAEELKRLEFIASGATAAELAGLDAEIARQKQLNEERRIGQRDLALHNQMVNAQRSQFEQFGIQLERIQRAGLNPEQEAASFANALRGLSGSIPERKLPQSFEMGSSAALSLINQNAIQQTSAAERLQSTLQTAVELQRTQRDYQKQLLDAWRDIVANNPEILDVLSQ